MQVIEDAKNKGKKFTGKNLKNLGISLDIIAEATGLDLETIEKL